MRRTDRELLDLVRGREVEVPYSVELKQQVTPYLKTDLLSDLSG